jgi:hypothetical protein
LIPPRVRVHANTPDSARDRVEELFGGPWRKPSSQLTGRESGTGLLRSLYHSILDESA